LLSRGAANLNFFTGENTYNRFHPTRMFQGVGHFIDVLNGGMRG